MYQEETIYNLVPKDKIFPEKESRYHSLYPSWIQPTASTFSLINTSYPNVANMSGEITFPRGAHPIKGDWKTFGRPLGGYKQDPSNFYKKGHKYIALPLPERLRSQSEIKKPSIPTLADKPIMGLVSNKNFVTANAVDAVLMQPKKKTKEEYDFLHKKYYGQIPRYLDRLKVQVEEEYKTIREMQIRSDLEESKRKKNLNEDEVKTLREGLLKKLEEMKYSYGKFTHKKQFDTLILLKRKETLEKEMGIIEKDLKRLDSKNVIVDLTR